MTDISSSYSALSTAAVLAASVKGGPGEVRGLVCFNKSGSIGYLRIYDKATAPLTSDTPVFRAMIPSNTSASGFVIPLPSPIGTLLGIGLRATLAVADNDATVLTANDFEINVIYR